MAKVKRYGMYELAGGKAVGGLLDYVVGEDLEAVRKRKERFVDNLRSNAYSVALRFPEMGDTAVRESVFEEMEKRYRKAGVEMPVTYREFWDLWNTAERRAREDKEVSA